MEGVEATGGALSVVGLRTGYGRLQVVNGLDLQIGPGETLGLLGPNGHGKSTALRTIAGVHPAEAGSVMLDGANVTNWGAERVAAAGLTLIPQGSALFSQLTVRECLLIAGRLPRAKSGRERSLDQVHSLFPRLLERRSQLVGTLSGGERQMVAIGMGIMSNPRVLILDEPTLGLSPAMRSEICRTLVEYKGEGPAMIIADGDLDFLFALVDRWQFVELGKTRASGDSSDRPSDVIVKEMYFGDSHV